MGKDVNTFGEGRLHIDKGAEVEARYYPDSELIREAVALSAPARAQVVVWMGHSRRVDVTATDSTTGTWYMTLAQAEQTIEQLQRAVEQARSYAAPEEAA